MIGAGIGCDIQIHLGSGLHRGYELAADRASGSGRYKMRGVFSALAKHGDVDPSNC